MTEKERLEIRLDAVHLAAACWCDPETENKQMDPDLAYAFARRLAGWMDRCDQLNKRLLNAEQLRDTYQTERWELKERIKELEKVERKHAMWTRRSR